MGLGESELNSTLIFLRRAHGNTSADYTQVWLVLESKLAKTVKLLPPSLSMHIWSFSRLYSQWDSTGSFSTMALESPAASQPRSFFKTVTSSIFSPWSYFFHGSCSPSLMETSDQAVIMMMMHSLTWASHSENTVKSSQGLRMISRKRT